jgi:endonuclease V-like protein UPF0215 family
MENSNQVLITISATPEHKRLTKALKAHINLSEEVRLLIEQLAKKYNVK